MKAKVTVKTAGWNINHPLFGKSVDTNLDISISLDTLQKIVADDEDTIAELKTEILHTLLTQIEKNLLAQLL